MAQHQHYFGAWEGEVSRKTREVHLNENTAKCPKTFGQGCVHALRSVWRLGTKLFLKMADKIRKTWPA